MGEPMMTLAQVAELLAVDEVTVRREVRRGRLAVARVGKQLRFDPAEVAAYLRRNREGAAA